VTAPTVVVVVARVPAAGVAAFRRYEELVLPLLADHGAALARRLRSDDGQVEVHVVEFPSRAALAAYHEDERRSAHAQLLAESGASVELLEPSDVPA
jgi:uncharacterized protein (DUF1330 family)